MNFFRTAFISFPFLFSSSISASEWVKITVPETGVYEITYEELREMGFSNPEGVGLIGRGGQPLAINHENDLFGIHPEVPVIHENGRLYFHAFGPESFSFKKIESIPTGTISGRFVNNGRNIYSDSGYYFLTDSPGSLLKMTETSDSSTTTKEATCGIGFVCHEIDMAQNSTDTGNLYWGESFNRGNPSEREWRVNIPEADTGMKGMMECVFYTEKDSDGTLTFGTDAPEGKKQIDKCTATSNNLTPVSGCVAPVAVKNGDNVVTVAYSSTDNKTGVANLDYWILSYQRNFKDSSLPGPCGMTAFPAATARESLRLKAAPSLRGIDITNPASPSLLNYSDGAFTISSSGETPVVTFFDTSETQKKIASWEKAIHHPGNSTLSEISAKGADLLIICPDAFIEYAEQIADIHRSHDSLTVATATLSQVYAEFSDALPDPSACRNLVIKFYNSSSKPLRNVLFIGPYLSDVRGINAGTHAADATIAVQCPTIHRSHGAYALPDFYGITTPNVDLGKTEYAPVSVGVGVLPFYNDADARLYIDKIKRYLSDTSHANVLSDWLYIGGTGDSHTHDWQAVRLARYVSDLSNKAIVNSVLAIDAYDSNEANKKFNEYLNAGKGFTIYIGHSSPAQIGQDNNFFSNSHIAALNNRHLTFLMTAGCNTTVSDQGRRGVGESMILSTPAGAVGGLVTLRETWSGQNDSFAKSFISAYTKSADGPLSIGEIYANAKTSSKNTNDLAFILMADPAITIPVPQAGIQLSAATEPEPGKRIEIKGKVTDASGNVNTGFNGSVVAKLAEPEYSLKSDDFYTKPKEIKKPLTVTYADNIAAMSASEVEDGEFTISLPVPADFDSFIDEKCPVYVSAFDPATFAGAAASLEMTMAKNDGPSPADDTTPPVIEEFYCDGSGRIIVTAYDDNALDLSSSSIPKPNGIEIDGANSISTALSVIEVADNGRRCTFSTPVPHLTDGVHTATVMVSDQHGNRSHSQIVFTLGEPLSALTLVLEETAVADTATFHCSGASGNKRILIISPSGKVVRRIDTGDDSVTWDRLDDAGNSLPAGLYKGVLLETSSTAGESLNRHSPVIFIPLV